MFDFLRPKPVKFSLLAVHRLKGKARRFEADLKLTRAKYGYEVERYKAVQRGVDKQFKERLRLLFLKRIRVAF